MTRWMVLVTILSASMLTTNYPAWELLGWIGLLVVCRYAMFKGQTETPDG